MRSVAMGKDALPSGIASGATFERDDGARLRIDEVTDDQVYFVSWLSGHETGSPIRMTHEVFSAAWARDWMRAQEETPKGEA